MVVDKLNSLQVICNWKYKAINYSIHFVDLNTISFACMDFVFSSTFVWTEKHKNIHNLMKDWKTTTPSRIQWIDKIPTIGNCSTLGCDSQGNWSVSFAECWDNLTVRPEMLMKATIMMIHHLFCFRSEVD